MRTIEITVSPKGETAVTTKGFAGSSCRDAIQVPRTGPRPANGETLTAEFHQTAVVDQQQLQRQ